LRTELTPPIPLIAADGRVNVRFKSTPVIENPKPITISVFAQPRWKAEVTNSILQSVSEEFEPS
jgi:hypothetical protein